jgi:hypothetical protein
MKMSALRAHKKAQYLREGVAPEIIAANDIDEIRGALQTVRKVSIAFRH